LLPDCLCRAPTLPLRTGDRISILRRPGIGTGKQGVGEVQCWRKLRRRLLSNGHRVAAQILMLVDHRVSRQILVAMLSLASSRHGGWAIIWLIGEETWVGEHFCRKCSRARETHLLHVHCSTLLHCMCLGLKIEPASWEDEHMRIKIFLSGAALCERASVHGTGHSALPALEHNFESSCQRAR